MFWSSCSAITKTFRIEQEKDGIIAVHAAESITFPIEQTEHWFLTHIKPQLTCATIAPDGFEIGLDHLQLGSKLHSTN